MNFTEYNQILLSLLEYREFQVVLELFRSILIAVIAVLLLLSLFHTLYYLGQRSPLYRRRPPVDGWNRRFYSMICFLTALFMLLAWGIQILVNAAK